MGSDPELITAGELAAYLKVHPITIYRLATRGEIPSFRVGGGWRFDKTTVDNWLREQQNCGKIRDEMKHYFGRWAMARSR